MTIFQMLLLYQILILNFVFINAMTRVHIKVPKGREKKLPDYYKDVFVAGGSARPTYGSTTTTCWARGGVCVEIRDCPHLIIDATVSGCTWGHRVCCKIFAFGPPTVGPARKYGDIIEDLQNLLLGTRFYQIAEFNSRLLLE